MANTNSVNIIQDIDKSIEVMLDAAKWLESSGKEPSVYWQSKNMNRQYLSKHAEPNEFYVAMIQDQPAASMILQNSERNQSWQAVDGSKPKKALYVHWLCVNREYAGKNLPRTMIDYAVQKAKSMNLKLLRLDTQADNIKLCQIYEKLGFHLTGRETDDKGFRTAFYLLNLD